MRSHEQVPYKWDVSAVKIGVLARLHCSSPTNPAPEKVASHSPRRAAHIGIFCFGDWANYTSRVCMRGNLHERHLLPHTMVFSDAYLHAKGRPRRRNAQCLYKRAVVNRILKLENKTLPDALCCYQSSCLHPLDFS